MILAAGRGARMGALTEHTPKPLLRLRDRPLIAHSLEALRRAGVSEVVVNAWYHADALIDFLGDGAAFDVSITVLKESQLLGTAGGIVNALPVLGSEPFYCVSADVVFEHEVTSLPALNHDWAHLVLVDNPAYHRQGDFVLEGSRVREKTHPDEAALTFANISVLSPRLFEGCVPGVPAELGPLLRKAASQGRVSGSRAQGRWFNVGTPEELKKASSALY